MNMLKAIEPRSDQMNSEDLLTGERTFTITDVKVYDSPEQPVSIWFAEFPKGRPFKPSKTVSKILVALWGAEESAYIGRRLTLYRDPKVQWGGKDVGGIRIKAMSDIGDKPKLLTLAESKTKKASWKILPLDDAIPASPPMDEETVARLAALRDEYRTADDDRKKAIEAEVAALRGGAA